MSTNIISTTNCGKQIKRRKLKKNKKRRKLSTFIEKLSIVTSEKQSKTSLFEELIPTSLTEGLILSAASPCVPTQNTQHITTSQQENPSIDQDDLDERPLLSIPKSELKVRTKSNTEMNAEYISDVQLVLKPVFLDQPRPPSPIIGSSSFLIEDIHDEFIVDSETCMMAEESPNPSTSIKWSKNLISFEPTSEPIAPKPVLKPKKEQDPTMGTSQERKDPETKIVTIKEFVYSDDSPIAINVLLSHQATSKYSNLLVDEFLSDISSSTNFKLSASTRRRLQVTRKGK